MGDRERAMEARAKLRELELDTRADSEAVDRRDQALEAVNALLDALEAAEGQESSAEREPPAAWDDENEEWTERLATAYEKAGIARGKGTLTTKPIDGRTYYYLQWREGDAVKSQYVAPVDPA